MIGDPSQSRSSRCSPSSRVPNQVGRTMTLEARDDTDACPRLPRVNGMPRSRSTSDRRVSRLMAALVDDTRQGILHGVPRGAWKGLRTSKDQRCASHTPTRADQRRWTVRRDDASLALQRCEFGSGQVPTIVSIPTRPASVSPYTVSLQYRLACGIGACLADRHRAP